MDNQHRTQEASKSGTNEDELSKKLRDDSVILDHLKTQGQTELRTATNIPKCPRCDSNHAVKGRILGQGDVGLGFVFRVQSLKALRFLGTDVSIPKQAFACCDCGLLWLEINAKKLTRIIKTKGTAKLRKQIQRKD